MSMMIMMTTVMMMMKVMMAIIMIRTMTPLVLISEGATEKHHDLLQSSDTQTHSHVDSTYLRTHTCCEGGGGPTYGAVNVRVAGWVSGEV